MDSQFPAIVDRLFEGAQILKAWRLEAKEKEERRRQEALQREKRQLLARMEQKRREKLIDAEVDWRVSGQLRDFISAIESLPDREQVVAGKTIKEWLSWAREVADTLDPLHGGAAQLFGRISGED
jgi:hypothetical protein